jgi:predicted nucleotidyltransferase
VERFGRALRERFGSRVRDVILFGSHARGEAHEESDADVMVAVDDLTDDERIGVFDLAVAVDRSLPEWVGLSPLAYSTAQTERMRAGGRRLFRDIEREGIRL